MDDQVSTPYVIWPDFPIPAASSYLRGMNKAMLFLLGLMLSLRISAASPDSVQIRQIYSDILRHGRCYGWLDTLCNQIGGRVSGSTQAEQAVAWGKQVMESLKPDRVYLQECMVPHWVRGPKGSEKCIMISRSAKKRDLRITALGGSIGTKGKAIRAGVIEVKTFEELAALVKGKVSGKIVFFNRAMNPEFINTFEAYGDAVNQRGRGAIEAAKVGAIGVIVRSMSVGINNHPHTGAMRYVDTITKIPAVAVSTADAEVLSQTLKTDPNTEISLALECEKLPDVKSYNVIGELRGSTYPDEIITVGGHLDSWETGTGAHDDGAGVVQSMEVLAAFRRLNIHPERTIRIVLFMNEENGLRGGTAYTEAAKAEQSSGKKHIAAIETDAGGFTPRGINVEPNGHGMAQFSAYAPLFHPYFADRIESGDGGADISGLKALGTVLMELMPDSQRYFDVHHAETDVFESVNRRELEMGAATVAGMVWLLTKYGVR